MTAFPVLGLEMARSMSDLPELDHGCGDSYGGVWWVEKAND